MLNHLYQSIFSFFSFNIANFIAYWLYTQRLNDSSTLDSVSFITTILLPEKTYRQKTFVGEDSEMS